MFKITMVMALSLDGKIGKDPTHFPDWTGKADKKLFVEETKKAGAFVMGSNTFQTIKRPLPGRKNIIMTRSPKVYEENFPYPELFFTDKSPKDIIAETRAECYNGIVVAGGAKINALWASLGLIDEVCVTICPKTFGEGINLFSKSVELDLQLIEHKLIDDNTMMLRYKVLK